VLFCETEGFSFPSATVIALGERGVKSRRRYLSNKLSNKL